MTKLKFIFFEKVFKIHTPPVQFIRDELLFKNEKLIEGIYKLISHVLHSDSTSFDNIKLNMKIVKS